MGTTFQPSENSNVIHSVLQIIHQMVAVLNVITTTTLDVHLEQMQTD